MLNIKGEGDPHSCFSLRVVMARAELLALPAGAGDDDGVIDLELPAAEPAPGASPILEVFPGQRHRFRLASPPSRSGFRRVRPGFNGDTDPRGGIPLPAGSLQRGLDFFHSSAASSQFFLQRSVISLLFSRRSSFNLVFTSFSWAGIALKR